jgi:hypothetical protein
MRFFILTSLVLTASAVAVTKVPDEYDPGFCDYGIALCDMATTFAHCSDGYIKFMEA